jgi:cell wall-associated NlpC family hydrolase
MMEPFGWVAILMGAFAVHAVFKGRVMEIPTDLKDLIVAVATGDIGGATQVLQRGSTRFVQFSPVQPGTTSVAPPVAAGLGLAAAAQALGRAAQGYRLTGTGPTWYDCSGLMWRAAQKIGLSVPIRFTTFTFAATAFRAFQLVTDPMVDDIVLWPTHHMGVITGADQFYSALSPAQGIGFSTISGATKDFGYAPQYWRGIRTSNTGPV